MVKIKKLINKKISALFLFILFNINFITFLSPSVISSSDLWWDDLWSFRQEIKLNIDTSQENAKYQPIDIRIEFDNPCWAINETVHSMRIIL